MKEKKLSNYEYLKSLNLELFHATLCGLMGIKLCDFKKENALMEWLKAEEMYTDPVARDKALASLIKEDK